MNRDQIRRWGKRGAIAVAVLVAVGGLTVVSGVVPLSAREGHFTVTEWVLHFAMRRSVATHSMWVEEPPPDLDSRARILTGAGHYEHGCRFCHGAPGRRMPVIPAAMEPSPPRLDRVASELDATELYYVVQHGVKMTAMPSWPAAARDDEIWALVAFLRTLDDLDASAYDALVTADDAERGSEEPAVVARVCSDCHGYSGDGREDGDFPRLSGQSPEYLRASLRAFATGDRHSGIMQPIAARLSEAELESAARYYAQRPPAESSSAPSPELGRMIATEGIPERDVASCVDCHGPDEPRRSHHHPTLAAQNAAYLKQQLELFSEGRRGGTEQAHLMRKALGRGLTADEIAAVAAYYSAAAAGPR